MKLTIGKFSYNMHYIAVPEDVVKKLQTKRVIVTINRRVTQHSAFNNSKEIGSYVYINKNVMKQFSLAVGDEVNVTFKADTTAFQSPMPEELGEVLDTDPLAKDAFDKLTPGAKRSFMYWVQQVKATDKRIDRALKLAENLKRGVTSIRQLVN